jgi:hypothetical protein
VQWEDWSHRKFHGGRKINTSTPLIRMFARDIETFEQFINRIKGLFCNSDDRNGWSDVTDKKRCIFVSMCHICVVVIPVSK